MIDDVTIRQTISKCLPFILYPNGIRNGVSCVLYQSLQRIFNMDYLQPIVLEYYEKKNDYQ